MTVVAAQITWRLIVRLANTKSERVKKRSLSNLRYYPNIWLEELKWRKTSVRTANLRGLDLNQKPPEQETKVPTTRRDGFDTSEVRFNLAVCDDHTSTTQFIQSLEDYEKQTGKYKVRTQSWLISGHYLGIHLEMLRKHHEHLVSVTNNVTFGSGTSCPRIRSVSTTQTQKSYEGWQHPPPPKKKYR
jgi:hypothetical protein